MGSSAELDELFTGCPIDEPRENSVDVVIEVGESLAKHHL